MELATRKGSATKSYWQDSCDKSSVHPVPSAPPVPDFSTSNHRSSILKWLMIYIVASLTSAFIQIFVYICIKKTVDIYYILFLISIGLIIDGFLFYGVIHRNVLVLRIQKIITTVFQILNTLVLLLLFISFIGFLVLGKQERMELQMQLEEQLPEYDVKSVAKFYFLVSFGLLIGALELYLRAYVIKKIIRVIRAETHELQSKNPPIDV